MPNIHNQAKTHPECQNKNRYLLYINQSRGIPVIGGMYWTQVKMKTQNYSECHYQKMASTKGIKVEKLLLQTKRLTQKHQCHADMPKRKPEYKSTQPAKKYNTSLKLHQGLPQIASLRSSSSFEPPAHLHSHTYVTPRQPSAPSLRPGQ